MERAECCDEGIWGPWGPWGPAEGLCAGIVWSPGAVAIAADRLRLRVTHGTWDSADQTQSCEYGPQNAL